MKKLFILQLILITIQAGLYAQKEKKKEDQSGEKELLTSELLNGLSFRGIGPALMSGRVVDIAVDPYYRSRYFVAVACGGVWKTENAGTTWTPVFENEKSFSIGCLAIDPKNTNIIWVGTGENNSQRSVSWGDGVYKSLDGGKTWKNMGLQKSEHIGKILIDPRNSDVVYVACQGPLWGPGGDRGLYKTSDGGKSWKLTLVIGENTGVSDLAFDPRNPDVIYATSYQRRRHVFTLIDGGPESGIHKSEDGGNSWRKLSSGLPTADLGRIGIAVSPANPDILYAVIEAAEGKGGIFRSNDRGESWEKRNDWVSGSPQYYQEIIADPLNPDKFYCMDTWAKVSNDGGKTLQTMNYKARHVDDHALYIDPKDTRYMIIGGDGGLYETFDGGDNWLFKSNLPVTQFYRVTADNSLPFYYLYAGTQDNNTQGGPSRTTSASGIVNSDWFITLGGDGFETVIDPADPNIVYSQYQYGGLIRYDKKTGESIDIKPQEDKGEQPYRWNWDAPLIISPHSHTRLYFGANYLFRSDDMGNSWEKISPDLTRQIDRNSLEVMGKIWGPDAVAKNASTSFYGNLIFISESPLKEGLIYVGTDDGLIYITDDGGRNWHKIEKFPGVPETTYVSCVKASAHDINTVYVSFDNHKRADFKPYVLKSTDAGKSWTSISSNLPDGDIVYSVAEDPVRKDLIFLGTEYGVWVTINGGKKWIRMKGGLPSIAVRDVEIQKRESDLILATFGRGIYILDDYSPLREITPMILEKPAYLFPVKDALMYIQTLPLGDEGKASQGDAFFTAPNPPFGATFTFYMKESVKTLKEIRKDNEKEALKKSLPVNYPDAEELVKEDEEEAPYLLFTVTDEDGTLIRNLKAPAVKGIQRITWDLRWATKNPASTGRKQESEAAMPALPGRYFVQVFLTKNGVISQLSDRVSFYIKPLSEVTASSRERETMLEFQKKVQNLNRALLGSINLLNETADRIDLIQNALKLSVNPSDNLVSQVKEAELETKRILKVLTGDQSLKNRNENVPPSVQDRIEYITWGLWRTSKGPTETMVKNYKIAGDEFSIQLEKLTKLVGKDLKDIESQLEKINAPYTPGRIPDWKPE